jgi:hypothetical protein
MIAAVLMTTAALGGVGGCVAPHSINQPIPGALDTMIADSTGVVLDAAIKAIRDRGISIRLEDRKSGVVESEFIDIGLLRNDVDPSVLNSMERMIKFRFRAVPSFGATRLFSEAVYRLGNTGGRLNERMIPAEHPARQVLNEMVEDILSQVARHQAEKANAPPGSR